MLQAELKNSLARSRLEIVLERCLLQSFFDFNTRNGKR